MALDPTLSTVLAYAFIGMLVLFVSQHASQRAARRGLYQTRRSLCLREAARLEAAKLRAREIAVHPSSSSVVCLAGEFERRWWTQRFGVSAGEIRTAIREVGPMVREVERYLAAPSVQSHRLAA